MHYLRARFILLVPICLIFFSLSAGSAEVLWHYDLGAPCFGSAAAADLDGDGFLEIVFGTYFNDEHIYCLNGKDGSLAWSYDTGGCNDASPVIADVDGDNRLEVVVPGSSSRQVYCFDGAGGQLEWQTSTGSYCIDSPPAVADVDGDGQMEVVLGTFNGWVYCLHGADGTVWWKVNLGADSYIQAGPNILDVDLDGTLDVVVAQFAGDCRVYALHGATGAVLWYSDAPQDYMYHGGSFADLDADGRMEIVIGSYDNHVYLLDSENGNVCWAYQANGFIGAPTSIGDLTGDGHWEIAFSSGTRMGVLGHNGQLLWDTAMGGNCFRGAALSDMDNDGLPDVVFGSDDGVLRVLQGASGQPIWSMDLESLYGRVFTMDNAPLVADFNLDGVLDVFIIGGHGTSSQPQNNHGRAYMISGSQGQGPDWLMFRHDPYHSGCQQEPAPGDPVYRFFNTRTGCHFYTISQSERNYIIQHMDHLRYEGAKFRAHKHAVSGTCDLYRFFNTNTGIHFYTISRVERDYILAHMPHFSYEGTAFYVFRQAQDHTPVYRFFNSAQGGHLYTISRVERDYIINNLPHYIYEGVKFHVMPR